MSPLQSSDLNSSLNLKSVKIVNSTFKYNLFCIKLRSIMFFCLEMISSKVGFRFVELEKNPVDLEPA